MDKRHIVNLQGRDFVLYAGLLAEAHEIGLESIHVELIQIPTEENGHTAIARATVRLKDGRECSDYGDASPRNCSPAIAKALIRMASTRAKGRALRDVTNVGVTMLEELDQEEDAPRAAPARTRTADALERAEQPMPISRPPARHDAGYEEVAEIEGKTYRRAEMLTFAFRALDEALKAGLKIEAITPHQATNEQLVAWGKTVRPLLKAATVKEEVTV